MKSVKEVTNEEINNIASYMNDELREDMHYKTSENF